MPLSLSSIGLRAV